MWWFDQRRQAGRHTHKRRNMHRSLLESNQTRDRDKIHRNQTSTRRRMQQIQYTGQVCTYTEYQHDINKYPTAIRKPPSDPCLKHKYVFTLSLRLTHNICI